jgi:hypothetical protein
MVPLTGRVPGSVGAWPGVSERLVTVWVRSSYGAWPSVTERGDRLRTRGFKPLVGVGSRDAERFAFFCLAS